MPADLLGRGFELSSELFFTHVRLEGKINCASIGCCASPFVFCFRRTLGHILEGYRSHEPRSRYCLVLVLLNPSIRRVLGNNFGADLFILFEF